MTVEEWWARAESKRAVAKAMADSREHCREAWFAAGFAVEFALKAVIMKRERMNRWPDKDERPELHNHDINRLMALAGINPRAEIGSIRVNLRVALQWRREYDYVGGSMERREARSMVDAVCGAGGVLDWLRTR
jgi:hypothetical protein